VSRSSLSLCPARSSIRILFREIAAYQDEADRLAAQAKPDGFLRNYHQKVFELSPALAAQLIPLARSCAQQIRALDAQAAAIVQAVKNQHKNVPRNSPNAMVPPAPPELANLETKRTAIILAAADQVATAFGPAQFAYFETLARQHVGSGFNASTPAGK